MKLVNVTFLSLLAASTIACTTPNPNAPACPAGESCDDEEPISCTPGEVLACSDDATATVCDESGTATTAQACDFGCNADAKRCNECTPNKTTCSDGGALETCGADGRVEASESCELGCFADMTTGVAAHCGHIEPKWLPTACDARTAGTSLTIIAPTTIDTDDDAMCNGGIVAQTEPAGPAICVVRYGTIEMRADVVVKGSRAIAFVADHALTLDFQATLDVGANNGANGPGGGFTVSGGAPSTGGGGGAGFAMVGALGGGVGEFGSGAGAGGGTFDPLAKNVFEGGAKAANAAGPTGSYRPAGGGGGGALMLVSCEGSVTVDGTIDAGGGGGGGGGDNNTINPGTTKILGGAGGGAGGYVVLQGARVVVAGAVFANGGGGGGGCNTDNCVAPHGDDGGRLGFGGAGGNGVTADGGAGALNRVAPKQGQNTMAASPGGGGGSVGRFQVFIASGASPVLSGVLEPSAEPTRSAFVR